MVKSLAHEMDGVVTDDPKRFLQVCEQWSTSHVKVRDGAGQRLGTKQTVLWLIINFMVLRGSW